VLRYVGRGFAKKQIAEMMNISVKTVDKHVTTVMDKLDIHDRVELARYAIREGLISA
jgi:DNA-binding NarL/FixJ family response regulator